MKPKKSILAMLAMLFAGGIALLTMSATPAMALPCDELGSSWNGCEYGASCEWNVRFVRQSCSSNVWNAYWSHPQGGKLRSQVTITKSGSTVTIIRPMAAGGVACTYTGTYKKRDVTNALPYRVSGTYRCSNGYVGPWRANIR